MASNLEPPKGTPRRFKFLTFFGLVSGMTIYSYRQLRDKNPQGNKDGVWTPFMQKVYPLMVKSLVSNYPRLYQGALQSHEVLHHLFLKASTFKLLPLDWSQEPISQKRACTREFFGSNLGVKTGLAKEGGNEVDGIFDMSEALSYIELGPTTIDPQHQHSMWTQQIEINLNPKRAPLKFHYKNARYSCNQIVYRLIERQERIRDEIIKAQKEGKPIPKFHSDRRIGVCIEANESTLDSVPYLTHQDFVKQVKELTDLCDYVILNIQTDKAQKPGLAQYYSNPDALEKLLKNCNDTRMAELGKHAALEYERVIGDGEDYATAIKKYYQSSSVISALKPLSLFLKIDPFSAEGVENPGIKAREMAQLCLKHDIEGIVVGCQSGKPEDLAGIIREIRKFDINNRLVVVAEGCKGQGVRTGAEAAEYLEAGADSCSMLSRMFSEGPFAPENIQKELNESLKI